MRKLRCIQTRGLSVQEVLDDFNEKNADDLHIKSKNILSVSVLPPTSSAKMMHGGEKVAPKVEVVIVYWEKPETKHGMYDNSSRPV